MLVVISIIAVLAAILLPVASSVTARSRATVCQSNLHQIYVGFAGYAADNNGVLPVIDQWRMGTAASPQTFYVWFTAIQPYVGKADVKQKTILTCPAINRALTTPIPVTYTLNRDLSDDTTKQINGTRANRLAQTSKKVLMFDSGQEWTSISYTELQGKDGTDPQTSTFTQIHNGKANVLFCDGHVDACDFKKDLADPTLWSLN